MPDNQNKLKRTHVASQSPDLRKELRARLRDLVPEAFAEGKLDTAKLRALLGENGDAGPERYSFSWAGKRDAIAMLQVPTRATLAPDRDNSVNFDGASHVFIEGENLEVLKVLYRSYFGRVKMIYIDPPYNTGNDFIYPDDFSDPLDNYLRITGQKNGNGDYTTSQVDRNGRIHSAWLSMMYPRLVLARQFLTEKGLIFVSIDEHEMYNLRMLMDEVFGEENFVSEIVWKKAYGGGAKAKHIVGHHEYILAFAKNKAEIDRIDLPPNPETRRYYKFKNSKFEKRGPYRTQPLWTNSMDDRENLRYPIFQQAQRFCQKNSGNGVGRGLKRPKRTMNSNLLIRTSVGPFITSNIFMTKREKSDLRSFSLCLTVHTHRPEPTKWKVSLEMGRFFRFQNRQSLFAS